MNCQNCGIVDLCDFKPSNNHVFVQGGHGHVEITYVLGGGRFGAQSATQPTSVNIYTFICSRLIVLLEECINNTQNKAGD